jgi:hypothetical protein
MSSTLNGSQRFELILFLKADMDLMPDRTWKRLLGELRDDDEVPQVVAERFFGTNSILGTLHKQSKKHIHFTMADYLATSTIFRYIYSRLITRSLSLGKYLSTRFYFATLSVFHIQIVNRY